MFRLLDIALEVVAAAAANVIKSEVEPVVGWVERPEVAVVGVIRFKGIEIDFHISTVGKTSYLNMSRM